MQTKSKVRRIKQKHQLPEVLKQYQFVKGKSGNPKGRPKGKKFITDTLRHLLDERAMLIPKVKEKALELGLNPKTTTVGATLAAQMVTEAMDGNGTFMKEIMDRIEGKIKELVEMKVEGTVTEMMESFMHGSKHTD